MNRLKIFIGLVCFLLLIFAINSNAAMEWKMEPARSKLNFSAVDHGEPVWGRFTSFNADISFDPQDLAHSKLNITVQINSLKTSYDELKAVLISPMWFDAAQYPVARFKAHDFKLIARDIYQASGELSIRDQSVPVVVNFMAQATESKKMIVNGGTIIKRSSFHIGQNEWGDTDQIQDEVKVNFKVVAVPKV